MAVDAPLLRSSRALALSCHPLPSIAVTAFTTAYAAAVGAPLSRLVVVALAVLAGQLFVGWSNDAIDAPRDRLARRADKPLANGMLTRQAVSVAAGLAAVACVLLSFTLGVLIAVLHLVAVAAAAGYNAYLKGTPASPLPYAVAFGLLPVVATLVATPAGHDPRWPSPIRVAAAALLGVAAHAANTVGDSAADAATGVRGLPQRLGTRRSLVATAVLVAVAALLVLAELAGRWSGLAGGQVARGVVAVGLLLVGVGLAVAGAVRGVGIRGGPGAFRLTLAAVGLIVAGFLITV